MFVTICLFLFLNYYFMEDLKADKNWELQEVMDLYHSPLLDLIYRAATVHRQFHNPREVQISTLVSIKTGGCPEDCAYCPQAARYHTDINKNDLMPLEEVKQAAANAKRAGSSRLCLGAAWRNVKNDKDFDQVLEMVETINKEGLEVCCTLGMLTENQAKRLANAGVYAYNHNLDSSDEYYEEIISTRSYEDRLKTLENVRKANMTICSGGIIGMGEASHDRCKMLHTLSKLSPQPESVPINALVAVKGTPMENQEPVSIWEMARMIATAKIVMPKSIIRLSAGRTHMSAEGQAICFLAGASSIFAGDKLLTTPNPALSDDLMLLDTLGLEVKEPFTSPGIKPEERAIHEIEEEGPKNPKWSRPGHSIERNLVYAKK
jgi:biotin synthase